MSATAHLALNMSALQFHQPLPHNNLRTSTAKLFQNMSAHPPLPNLGPWIALCCSRVSRPRTFAANPQSPIPNSSNYSNCSNPTEKFTPNSTPKPNPAKQLWQRTSANKKYANVSLASLASPRLQSPAPNSPAPTRKLPCAMPSAPSAASSSACKS